MARVTIEDCILQVPNRFDLVVLAARRSRDIASGAPLAIERDDDKNPIIALREIAGQHVHAEEISESVTQSFQRFVETDDAEEAVVELGAPQDLSPQDLSPQDLSPQDLSMRDDSGIDEAKQKAELPEVAPDSLTTVEATEPEISDPSAISIAELTEE